MYSELYEAWQREINSPTLQPLSSDFYNCVANYIQTIRKESHLTDKKSLKTNLLEQELKNVKLIIKQLTRIRYRKIVKLLNDKHEIPSYMLSIEETQLSKGYLPFVKGYRTFVKGLLQGQTQQQPQPQQIAVEKTATSTSRKRVILRFMKAMPAVVGSDLKMYGPFSPEDVASVPVDNAKLLIKQGFAVAIAVS